MNQSKNRPMGLSFTPDGKVRALESWDDVHEGNDKGHEPLLYFENGKPLEVVEYVLGGFRTKPLQENQSATEGRMRKCK